MSKKIVFEIIAGLILLALLIVGIVGFQFYQAPMSEPLSIVQANPASVDQVGSAGSAQTAPQKAASVQATTVSAPMRSPSKQLCGMTGSMTVLMIGRDEYHWEPPFGADAIRLIKVNFDQGTVKVFAFERDLLLSTPNLQKLYGVDEFKLGPAYLLVRNKEGNKAPGADIKATNAVAQILYDNFGIVPDHYVTIEETVLPKVIDTISGIKVNVPEAIKGGGLTVAKGVVQMNGKTAMMYSRYLKNGLASKDEWGRMERQAAVFKAMAVRMLEPEVYTKIPELYKQVNKTVVTDLSLQQIQTLACVAKEIPLEAATLKTIERDQMNIAGDETMTIKKMDDVKALIKDLFTD